MQRSAIPVLSCSWTLSLVFANFRRKLAHYNEQSTNSKSFWYSPLVNILILLTGLFTFLIVSVGRICFNVNMFSLLIGYFFRPALLILYCCEEKLC